MSVQGLHMIFCKEQRRYLTGIVRDSIMDL